ncbi:hypothetical protein Hanom_Chr12g01106711 [Helianthus anomalus]
MLCMTTFIMLYEMIRATNINFAIYIDDSSLGIFIINTVSSQLMENTCSYCYHIIRASNQIYTGMVHIFLLYFSNCFSVLYNQPILGFLGLIATCEILRSIYKGSVLSLISIHFLVGFKDLQHNDSDKFQF